MLKENGAPPSGRWADIAVLEPVRDYKARHASTMLTFDAVVDAIDQIEAKRGPRGGRELSGSIAAASAAVPGARRGASRHGPALVRCARGCREPGNTRRDPVLPIRSHGPGRAGVRGATVIGARAASAARLHHARDIVPSPARLSAACHSTASRSSTRRRPAIHATLAPHRGARSGLRRR